MSLTESQYRIIENYFKSQPVLKAYLFGSYAKNKANEKSDIDILVELDHNVSIGLGFVQMKIDLEKILQKPVDLVSANGLSDLLAPFIHKEKRLIFNRQNN